MIRLLSHLFQYVLLLTCGLLSLALHTQEATAAPLLLHWTNKSNNAKNFKIERSPDSRPSKLVFAQITTVVGANVSSYADESVTGGSTYCYRVRASNFAGDSAYSNIACGTALIDPPALSVSLAAPPPGATLFGSAVPLSALVTGDAGAVGVQFLIDGNPLEEGVLPPPSSLISDTTLYSVTWDTTTVADGLHVLTVRVQNTPASTIASAPVAITVNNSCSDSSQTNQSSCPQDYVLTVINTGAGGGAVTSTPTGITCESTCAASYSGGTVVTLTATPTPGSTFAGWSGACAGAAPCTVTMSTAQLVTAVFARELAVKIGVFRPNTGEWFLDVNGDGIPNDCTLGGCIQSLGEKRGLPSVGDWLGMGTIQLGVFDPVSRLWKLDRNGDDRWDNCAVDLCIGPIFSTGDLPVVGRWTAGVVNDRIGVYRPRYSDWRLDLNGNGRWDGCSVDMCGTFGKLKGLPVVGDWTGSGTIKIGVFDPITGWWRLDRNGNGKWDGCAIDSCLGFFGVSTDRPVVGDWTGTGQLRIGVFDPITGRWELDINGNGGFDGCQIDACLGPFGHQGDLPVVGKW